MDEEKLENLLRDNAEVINKDPYVFMYLVKLGYIFSLSEPEQNYIESLFINSGIDTSLNGAPKIQVSDHVKVVNKGSRYNSYNNFFYDHGITNLLDNYPADVEDGDTGKVIFIGEHSNSHLNVYVVKMDNRISKDIILIGRSGIILDQ